MSKAKSVFVTGKYGIKFAESDSVPAVHQLVSLALRRNIKRAHLLVSEVLGKHIPQDPRLVIYAGHLLGAKVGVLLHPSLPYMESIDECAIALARVMDGELLIDNLPEIPKFVPYDDNVANAVVIGFAETATGLGFNVADYLEEWYIHSTRNFGDRDKFVGFEEEHSHATSHALVPDAKSPLLEGNLPLVLVDDEFSTGKTVQNIILELHAKVPRDTYIIASLVDCRSDEYKRQMDEFAAKLDVQISVVSLAHGEVILPEGLIGEVQNDISGAPCTLVNSGIPAASIAKVSVADAVFGTVHSRFGVTAGSYVPALPEGIALAVLPELVEGSTLFLGQEEFMHLPLLAAEALSAVHHEPIKSSTTTRSPIFANELFGNLYPVKSGIKFNNKDSETRFAYNVQGFSNVVLILEPEQCIEDVLTENGLVDILATVTEKIIVVETTGKKN